MSKSELFDRVMMAFCGILMVSWYLFGVVIIVWLLISGVGLHGALPGWMVVTFWSLVGASAILMTVTLPLILTDIWKHVRER